MWKKKKAVAEVKNNEVFLEHKRMKKWEDTNSGKINYMLYARSLFITWGGQQYWTWSCFKETRLSPVNLIRPRVQMNDLDVVYNLYQKLSDENTEVAKLLSVCWLDVRGKFKTSQLSPGVEYEIAYQVKLTKSASGWELPLTLRLRIPDGTVRERQVSILHKPRGTWFELNGGSFLADDSEEGEVWFDIMNHGGHWKTGLIIKGVAIRPITIA